MILSLDKKMKSVMTFFQMHSKELQLLEVLFPCLIEFLEKAEGPKNSPERYARLKIFLRNYQ
jgi:hypothetical protein